MVKLIDLNVEQGREPSKVASARGAMYSAEWRSVKFELTKFEERRSQNIILPRLLLLLRPVTLKCYHTIQ